MNIMPIYHLSSPLLAAMLNVTDIRAVKSRIKEIGAPIRGKGKNSYIITEELISALKSEDKKSYIYTPKNKANDFFS